MNIDDVLRARRDEHEQERKQARQKRLVKVILGIGLIGVFASTGVKLVLGYVQGGSQAHSTSPAQGAQDQGYILYSATGMTRLTQAEYDAIVKKDRHK